MKKEKKKNNKHTHLMIPKCSIKQSNTLQLISLHTSPCSKPWRPPGFMLRNPTRTSQTAVSKDRRPVSSPNELGWVVCSGLLTQAVFADPGSGVDVPLCSVQIALPPNRNRFAAYSPRNRVPKQNLSRQLLELQTICTMAAVCCVHSNAMQLDPETFGLILI